MDYLVVKICDSLAQLVSCQQTSMPSNNLVPVKIQITLLGLGGGNVVIVRK